MVTYCQAGDTARVTLPDGTARDFNDTPINIEISQSWGDLCQAVKVFYSFERRTYLWWINTYTAWELVSSNTNCIANIYGIRGINFSNGSYQIQIHSHGTTFCTAKGWYGFLGGSGGIEVRDAKIIRVENTWNGGVIISPSYTFQITGNSGNILFNQSFLTGNYSVDCIQSCPPNTLDCGDCCLGCNSIFNSISDIRRLISTIR